MNNIVNNYMNNVVSRTVRLLKRRLIQAQNFLLQGNIYALIILKHDVSTKQSITFTMQAFKNLFISLFIKNKFNLSKHDPPLPEVEIAMS